MSRDFLSLSPSPICSHVPAGGLLEEKFISRMIKLACMPIFTPSSALSLFLLPPPLLPLALALIPSYAPPFSLLSAPALSLLYPPPPTQPRHPHLAAAQWAFLSVTLISSWKGGKCENFPWHPLISVGEELRVAFGAFFFPPVFTEHSFVINWQPSHKGIGLFLC